MILSIGWSSKYCWYLEILSFDIKFANDILMPYRWIEKVEENPIDEVIKVLNQISREELESAMDELKQRLQAYIAKGGNYAD